MNPEILRYIGIDVLYYIPYIMLMCVVREPPVPERDRDVNLSYPIQKEINGTRKIEKKSSNTEA